MEKEVPEELIGSARQRQRRGEGAPAERNRKRLPAQERMGQAGQRLCFLTSGGELTGRGRGQMREGVESHSQVFGLYPDRSVMQMLSGSG